MATWCESTHTTGKLYDSLLQYPSILIIDAPTMVDTRENAVANRPRIKPVGLTSCARTRQRCLWTYAA